MDQPLLLPLPLLLPRPLLLLLLSPRCTWPCTCLLAAYLHVAGAWLANPAGQGLPYGWGLRRLHSSSGGLAPTTLLLRWAGCDAINQLDSRFRPCYGETAVQ